MPVTSIDPIQTYYRVASSLFGRILLFFSAGWCGSFLARLALSIREFEDFLDIDRVISNGIGTDVLRELLATVFWPVVAAISAAQVSVWLFFFAGLVIAVTFVVFIYTEEPAPAWWTGLVGFVALLHAISTREATWVSWLVLLFILGGLGAAFWWALRVWHPELVESLGAFFRGGQGSRASYTQIRKKAPPGAWPDPVKGWDDDSRRK